MAPDTSWWVKKKEQYSQAALPYSFQMEYFVIPKQEPYSLPKCFKWLTWEAKATLILGCSM